MAIATCMSLTAMPATFQMPKHLLGLCSQGFNRRQDLGIGIIRVSAVRIISKQLNTCVHCLRFVWWRTFRRRRNIHNRSKQRHQPGLGGSSRVWTQLGPGTFQRAGIDHVPLVQGLYPWYRAYLWWYSRDTGALWYVGKWQVKDHECTVKVVATVERSVLLILCQFEGPGK